MSPNTVTPIDPNLDPCGYLGFIKNPDGSITRIPDLIPTCPASSDPANNPVPVLSKAIPINKENNTWARVYLPRPESDPTNKVPLIVFFHGGGFIAGSAATSMFHKFCMEIANEVQAVVVSVEYRLGPEHRLPAAYDDGMEALHWITTTGDELLTSYVDFTRCSITGGSSGGNIAYYVGLRAITCVDCFMPLRIQGLILQQPFFGGVERTPSEIRLVNDKILPQCATDTMWDLGLPIGANRDHEYCNVVKDIKLDLLEKVKNKGWKILVTGYDGDPLIDRQVEFLKMLKENGVDVIDNFSDGGCHGIEVFDESRAKIFYGVIKDFVLSL